MFVKVIWGGLLFMAGLTGRWEVLGAAAGQVTLSNLPLNPPPTRVLKPRQADDALTSGLKLSSWIWTPETSPPFAPPVPRAFRRTYTIPPGKSAASASILITADNEYTLYINGHLTGSTQGADARFGWQSPHRYGVAPLAPDTNVFAVTGVNVLDTVSGGYSAAGLLVAIEVTHEDGSTVVIRSDGTWRASKVISGDFQALSFDDSAWGPAGMLGGYGARPWDVDLVFPTTEVVVDLPAVTAPSNSSTSSTPSHPPASSSSSQGSSPVGPIVGGVIGGVGALCLVVLLVLYRKRRLQDRRSRFQGEVITELSSGVHPFLMTGTHTGQGTPGSYSTPTDPSTASLQPMRKSDLPSSDVSYPPPTPPAVSATSESQQDLLGRVGRRQRLQDLVSELNRELAESGEGSAYVSELRGRIAELTREEGENELRRETVPPPYQAGF